MYPVRLRSIYRSAAQAFVGFDGQRCVYRRTPALGCGVAAALLALTGVATGRRRAVAVKYCKNAWFVRA